MCYSIIILYIRPSNQIQQDIYATHNLKKWVLPDLLYCTELYRAKNIYIHKMLYKYSKHKYFEFGRVTL